MTTLPTQAGQPANNQQPVNSQLTARQPGISQQAGKAEAGSEQSPATTTYSMPTTCC